MKLGAASLGSHNTEAQVLLMNAVKDVASALGDLVQATKAASGKNIDDPAMAYLKDSAKVRQHASGCGTGPCWGVPLPCRDPACLSSGIRVDGFVRAFRSALPIALFSRNTLKRIHPFTFDFS